VDVIRCLKNVVHVLYHASEGRVYNQAVCMVAVVGLADTSFTTGAA
jgi:hypothetical protein